MKYFKYFLILTLFASALSANAQRFTSKKRYWSGGIALNGMTYFGDITPQSNATSFDIRMTRPELGFFVTRRLYPRLSVRGSLSYGAIRGDDFVSGDASSINATNFEGNEKFFRASRNQHFRNRIAELSGTFIFDLVQNRGFFYRRPDKPIPYVFAGVALAVHNPQAQAPEGGWVLSPGGVPSYEAYTETNKPWTEDVDPGQWVNLRDYKTEGVSYSSVLINIPFGIGVRYKLNDKLDIAFEAGYRWTFTDYLDDVSGRYVEHDQNSLAYYLADRSFASSLSGDTREGITQAIYSRYPTRTSVSTGDYIVTEYSSVIGSGAGNDYPGERRGDDGTAFLEPDNGPKGPFSTANDVYIVYGVHLSYIFTNSIKCPKFR